MTAHSVLRVLSLRGQFFFMLSLSWVDYDLSLSQASDFSSGSLVRAWRFLESESTLRYRRSYVYSPDTPGPNLAPETLSLGGGVSLEAVSQSPD